MSARPALTHALLWLTCGICGTVLAADAGEPEMEFLEYLGLWAVSDEEWLIIDGQLDIESGERIDPAPRGEESTETDNER